jgi:hypothetical protein
MARLLRSCYVMVMLVVGIAWFVLRRLARGLVRARWLALRVTLTTVVLLALSGYTRRHLGLDDYILDALHHIQSGWMRLLHLTGLVEGIVVALTPLPLFLGMWAAAWFVVTYVRSVECYVISIYLLITQDVIGIRLSSAQLKLFLTLPGWIVFTICWPGVEGLIALGNAIFILICLDRFIDKRQARQVVASISRFNTSLAGGSLAGKPRVETFREEEAVGDEPVPDESVAAAS